MPQISLTNTLTRRKEAFVPTDPKRVTLYVCGPTVYNYAHIGNMRPPVVFDTLFRLLRHVYGAEHVVYARNYTDIDDKIIAKAAAEGVAIDVVTEKFKRAYDEDTASLGALPTTLSPRATQHVDGMIALTQKLIDSGAAYVVPTGVYFSVGKDGDYGKLSNRSQDDLKAGARVEGEDDKRHPSDFALWKAAKPGEPAWEAPFGAGRPGWHIECSAMIEEELGSPIDIHGGGIDLIFPHHENEIAQSETAHGHALARFWLHNGFLTMTGEKMSKSLGNIVTPRELLADGWQGETLRWALLSAHYKAPLDFNEEMLKQAQSSLTKIYQTIFDADAVLSNYSSSYPADFEDAAQATFRSSYPEFGNLLAALADDLNTPLALSYLHELRDRLKAFLLGPAQSRGNFEVIARARRQLLEGGELLGLLRYPAVDWLKGDPSDAAEIDKLVADRVAARVAKNYAESDRLRDELAARGVEVMDSASGSTWRRKG